MNWYFEKKDELDLVEVDINKLLGEKSVEYTGKSLSRDLYDAIYSMYEKIFISKR